MTGRAGERSAAVEVLGATVRFGSTYALRGLSLVLEGGTVTALEGPNGAGKSTVLRLIAGLVRPVRGEVRVLGESGDAARHSVGYVGHESFGYRALTGGENVGLAARAHGVSDRRGELALERVGGRALAGKIVGAMSRGQRQRVALAMALVAEPRVLLLDEAWTGLDREGSAAMDAVVREESARGVAVAFVTHSAERAAALAGRRVALRNGRAQ